MTVCENETYIAAGSTWNWVYCGRSGSGPYELRISGVESTETVDNPSCVLFRPRNFDNGGANPGFYAIQRGAGAGCGDAYVSVEVREFPPAVDVGAFLSSYVGGVVELRLLLVLLLIVASLSMSFLVVRSVGK